MSSSTDDVNTSPATHAASTFTSDASSAVLIDDAEVQQAEEEHAKAQTALKSKLAQNVPSALSSPSSSSTTAAAAFSPPRLITSVSLLAVRLSAKVAQSVLSAVATASLMATVAPESVVRATALVADMQSQSTYMVANSLLVHIPSDTVTLKLVQKLVMQYAAVNPGCLSAIGKLSPGAAAATTALGGALPMIVAAALQESVEVSRLVSGSSTKEQFAVASAYLAAQLAGGVAGLAAGASLGTMILPGVGTGIGSVAGSYVGSYAASMWLPSSSAVAAAVATSKAIQGSKKPGDGNSGAAPALLANASAQKSAMDEESEIPHAAFVTGGDGHNNNGGVNKFSFFFDCEVTSDGFVLVNPASLLEDDENTGGGEEGAISSDDDERNPKAAKTPEQHRRAFEETARALLHRATVVPLSSVVNTPASSSSFSNAGGPSESAFLTPAEQSRRAFECIEQLPGTVLILQSNPPSSASSFANQQLQQRGSERSSLYFHQQQNDDQADNNNTTAASSSSSSSSSSVEPPPLLAEIGGRMWTAWFGNNKTK